TSGANAPAPRAAPPARSNPASSTAGRSPRRASTRRSGRSEVDFRALIRDLKSVALAAVADHGRDDQARVGLGDPLSRVGAAPPVPVGQPVQRAEDVIGGEVDVEVGTRFAGLLRLADQARQAPLVVVAD